MKTYFLSLEAERDLEDIVDYIAQDNPIAAQTTLDNLRKAMDNLASFPEMGHLRPDIRSDENLRFWPATSHYLIVYLTTDPMQIVRVISGYRDLINLL